MQNPFLNVIAVLGILLGVGLLVKLFISIANSIDERKQRKHREKLERLRYYKESMKDDFEEFFKISRQFPLDGFSEKSTGILDKHKKVLPDRKR